MQRRLPQMTVGEYLEWESHSKIKHEYVDGVVYAMAGASRRHNLLVTNLIRRTATAAAARGQCQVFGSDMKVHVKARNSFYYPDVSACCDPLDRNELCVEQPCLIIEVLSPATAGIDRREKRLSYATLKSLHEYIIVDQDRMRVDVFPGKGGPWVVRMLNEPEDVVELSCLSLRLPLREIYEGVEFPPGVSEPEAPEYVVM